METRVNTELTHGAETENTKGGGGAGRGGGVVGFFWGWRLSGSLQYTAWVFV